MRIFKKIRGKNGVSLAETLVALGVFAILSCAIIVGVTSAAKIYSQSVTLAESNTLMSTLTQGISDELRYAENITTIDGKVYFDSTNFGPSVTLDNSGDGVIVVNSKDGTRSYELVGRRTYTSGLKAYLTLNYDGTKFEYTVTLKMGTKQLQQVTLDISPFLNN